MKFELHPHQANALRAAGFSDEEMGLLRRVAEDLHRSDRSASAVRIPGQSNTAQDQLAAKGSAGSVLRQIVQGWGSAGAGFGGGLIYSGSVTGAAVAAIPGLVGVMRQRGLNTVDEIVTDALLNPARARLLLAQPGTRKSEARTIATLRRLYVRAGASSSAEALREEERRSPGVMLRGDRRSEARMVAR